MLMQKMLVVPTAGFGSGIFVLPFERQISYFWGAVEIWLALLWREFCSRKVKGCVIVLMQLLKVAQWMLTLLFDCAVIGTVLLAYRKFINRLLSFTTLWCDEFLQIYHFLFLLFADARSFCTSFFAFFRMQTISRFRSWLTAICLIVVFLDLWLFCILRMHNEFASNHSLHLLQGWTVDHALS